MAVLDVSDTLCERWRRTPESGCLCSMRSSSCPQRSELGARTVLPSSVASLVLPASAATGFVRAQPHVGVDRACQAGDDPPRRMPCHLGAGGQLDATDGATIRTAQAQVSSFAMPTHTGVYRPTAAALNGPWRSLGVCCRKRRAPLSGRTCHGPGPEVSSSDPPKPALTRHSHPHQRKKSCTCVSGGKCFPGFGVHCM